MDWSVLAKAMVTVVAVLYIAVYLLTALSRLPYPFELEWMEGESVNIVARLVAGQRIYVSPSLEFVPSLYTPLYYQISALVAHLTGTSFLPLRLVSLASSLACFALIYLIVARETGDRFSAIVSASLLAATFKISGVWFDIGRVDSTFLFFLLAAIYLIRFQEGITAAALAGAVLSLAFLTKQTSLAMALPVIVYSVCANWRRGVLLASTIAIIVASSTLALNVLNDGWFLFYIVELPRSHPVITSYLPVFWEKDILLALPVGCFAFAFYAASQIWRRTVRSVAFYSSIAIGFILASLVGRMNWGGYENDLIPAYASLALLFGLGVHEALRFVQVAPVRYQSLSKALVYLVCLAQFGLLAYNPLQLIPTRHDREVGERFINMLSEIDGNVYVPFHSYLPTLAGKKSYAHAMAIADLIRLGPDGQAKTLLVTDIQKAYQDRRFTAIITDAEWADWWLPEGMWSTYTLQRTIFNDETGFWPITGMKTRPQFIYIAKN